MSYERLLDKISIEKAMEELDEQEKTIIKLRYYSDLTQAKIAEKLGISQVQVSRMEKKILIKMRKKLSNQ